MESRSRLVIARLLPAAHDARPRRSPSRSVTRTLTRSGSDGGDVLAHVVGADGQLAVAPVDQHRELDAARPAEVEERVDGRADGAPGVEHVVDEHDGGVVEAERQLGAAHLGLLAGGQHPRFAAHGHVVAVEADVQCAQRHVATAELGQQVAQPLGQHGAARVDADDGEGWSEGFFSRISCAMRVSVRAICARP